jgi:hypothetical protein
MSPPAGYEKMRDKFKEEGMDDKEAKARAAKIWNKNHPDNPVGPGKHEEVPTDDSRQLVQPTGKVLKED